MLGNEERGCEDVGKMEWVLADNFAGRLSELKDKLVCYFKLVADMVKSGIREHHTQAPWPSLPPI